MNKVAKWFDNFWYHYKWHVLIISFFLIFFIIATTQMVTKQKIDINVLYTGPTAFSFDGIRNVEAAFRQVMSEDYNGDGERGVQFLDITLMTEAQIKKAQAEAEADGMGALVINGKVMADAKKQFNNEIFAGESIICLLDPEWYNTVREADGFMKLSDIVGAKPEAAFDDYGIYLSDTDFGRFFTCFDDLPEDTILCFRRMSTTTIFKNKKEEEARYNDHKQMLADILAFTLPDGWEETASEDTTAE